ncbi:MAG: hypothetical protein JEZ05_11060 [Tenericutes bacterium]|nr:hypothetical protein [Mycoplasmatota bacterium]
MSRLNKYEEKQKKLSRFQALKSIFSSFLITVTAVVVIVVVTPKSPKAEIQSLRAFNNAIIYSINVTDSDSAIIEDTLIVTLENQFEAYETTLVLGNNFGKFLDLQDDTEYKLKVLADKGFGLEVLDSQTIYTAPVAGGVLLSSELIEEGEWNYVYQLEYLVNDVFNEYKSIQVRYGYKYNGEVEVFNYTTEALSFDDSSFIIDDANSNMEVFVYLEAVTQEDNTVILDEMSFLTPYQVYASLSPMEVSNTTAEFSIWLEQSEEMDIEYEALLMINDYIVQRKSIIHDESEDLGMHHGGVTVEFTDLLMDQEYSVALLAKYQDPITLKRVEVNVNSFDFVTLTNFSVDYQVIDNETYIEVTINLSDPEARFTDAYYTVWEVTEFGTWQYESMSYDFIEDGDQLYISFTISLPVLEEMIIDIGISDSSQFYYKVILEKLDYTEEVLG